ALRKTWGLPRAQPAPPPPPSADDRRYSVDEAAVVLGVAAGTVFTWVRRGRLRGAQVAKGQPWTIALTPDEIAALRARAARDRPRVRQLSMEVV
ncbi:MAG TPA: helix-turn-helix domain-containing protein, partial [Gemmatimonadales bacterium]|nr:helix-turn-helix domain-containing protein [Gemmatimonadales bacterium]